LGSNEEGRAFISLVISEEGLAVSTIKEIGQMPWIVEISNEMTYRMEMRIASLFERVDVMRHLVETLPFVLRSRLDI
jgi:hypothetical protein